MKKITLIIILIFTICDISNAGSKRTRYNRCWFGTKYSTLAHVVRIEIGGSTSGHRQASCDNCSGCDVYIANCSICDGAQAWAVSKPGQYWGLIKIKDTRWTAGKNPYQLLSSYYKQPAKTISKTFLQKKLKLSSPPPPPPPPPYYGVYSKDSSSAVVFDSINGTITLTNYFANLKINQDTLDLYYVNLSITGLYNKTGDEDDTNDSIFKNINVYIEGSNPAVITGISSSYFTHSIGSEEVICSYNGGDLVLFVPSNVDFAKVGVSVLLDGGRIPEVEPFVLSEQKKLNSSPKFECKNIFPNPVANTLNVSIYSSKKSMVAIRIVDVLGKELFFEKDVPFYPGNNLRQIPSEFLKAGAYFLIINDGKRDYKIKFLKNAN